MADLRGGIDLGGTKIQTAIVDGRGEVVGQARQPTPTSGGPEDVAAATVQYPPEAGPGPHDARHLFDSFLELAHA